MEWCYSPSIVKTALAVYAAHRMRDRFPDGQLFIDLHGFTQAVAPVEPPDALSRLLRMLGIPGERIPTELDDRAALWRSVLSGRRMLIVLDNAATEAQVAPLLPGESGCLVLVTSRHRLDGLEATHTVTLDTLHTNDAVVLFASAAGHQLTPESRGLAVEAVELCGRLPLAVRITAARLQGRPGWALAELVAQLRDEERRLATLDEPGNGGRSVTAAMELSYQQLAAGPQHMYRMLGLHPGPGFDGYAAAALAAVPLGRARERLDRLVAAHLLQEPAPGRYAFHDLVRAHAAGIAERAPDRPAALARLLDYYRNAATAAIDAAYPYERHSRPQAPPTGTPHPDFSGPVSALGWLDIELPNLLAAARCATDHGWPEHVLHLSAILQWHLRTSGRFGDADALHQQALTTARGTGHQAGELTALVGIGDLHLLQCRYEQAAIHFGQALQIARETGNRAGEVSALQGLGWVGWRRGRLGHGVGKLQQALQVARETGNRGGEAHTLTSLGHVHLRQGRHEQATSHLQQALQIARETGNRSAEVNALHGLGWVHLRHGRLEQAAHHFLEALQLARATGNRGGELNALNGLGHLQLHHGQHELATDHYQQLLQLARATRHRSSEMNALNRLGHLQLHHGRHDLATDHYQQLAALARESGDRHYEFEAWQGLGRVRHATGHPRAAIGHHDQALTLARELDHLDDQARAHDGLAHAYTSLHQPAQARRHWQRAMELLSELGTARAVGVTHTEDEHITVAAIRTHLARLDR